MIDTPRDPFPQGDYRILEWKGASAAEWKYVLLILALSWLATALTGGPQHFWDEALQALSLARIHSFFYGVP